MVAPLSPEYQSPWTPPWPTPYQIPWWQFSGDPSVDDELGNTLANWNPLVQTNVQGWDLLTSEELGEHAAQEKFEVFLMVQPDFWPAIRDRFGLPIPDNGMIMPTSMFATDGSVALGIFEVVGHDIENYGFHRWHPANIILLKRVEG